MVEWPLIFSVQLLGQNARLAQQYFSDGEYEKAAILYEKLYEKKALCDYGLYMGATIDNAEAIVDIASRCVGLKMYLNSTFGDLKLDNMESWMKR